MYDFRHSRRSKTAKSKSQPARRVKPVLHHPVPKRKAVVARRTSRVVKPSRQDSHIVALFKAITSLTAGVAIIALCGYFFLTRLATFIWPLTTAQTILLVPSQVSTSVSSSQSLSYVQVVVLDPSTQSVNVAELASDIPLSADGELTVMSLNQLLETPVPVASGAISLHLGRIVDYTVVMPSAEPIREDADLKRSFQAILGSQTPGLEWTEKVRWWLFALSLSDTDVRIRNMAN